MSPARRLLRDSELRLLAVAAFAASLSIVVLCLVLYSRTVASQEFRKQTATNCVGLEKIKTQIRGVFEESLAAAESRADLDPVQKRAIVDYYRRQLARFAPDECPSP